MTREGEAGERRVCEGVNSMCELRRIPGTVDEKRKIVDRVVIQTREGERDAATKRVCGCSREFRIMIGATVTGQQGALVPRIDR